MKYIGYFILILVLSSCSQVEVKREYPKTSEQKEEERVGKLTGEGFFLAGGQSSRSSTLKDEVKVNPYLWKATLDNISFMPLNSADSQSGIVITDWYSLDDNSEIRYKLNVFILRQELKSDSIKVNAYKQRLNKNGRWEQIFDNKISNKVKENILDRARALKVMAEKGQ